MAAQREDGELPRWYLVLFIGLPLGLVSWVGAISLCYFWLSNAGLIGGA